MCFLRLNYGQKNYLMSINFNPELKNLNFDQKYLNRKTRYRTKINCDLFAFVYVMTYPSIKTFTFLIFKKSLILSVF